MPYEQQDNQGGLFINNEKGDNPHRPDYTGTMTMNGTKFRLAGWLRKSKSKDEDWISIKVSPYNPPTDEDAPKAKVTGFPQRH